MKLFGLQFIHRLGTQPLTRENDMSKAIEMIKDLLEDGYDVGQCLDFLSDGESMSKMGITDPEDVELAVDFVSDLASV